MRNLKICFIRHGTTGMNQLGLFCGRTDALLAKEGWEELIQLKETYDYPEVERVYSSPALRCRETAAVFYPELEPVIKEGLWEFDFGQGEKTPAVSYKGTDLFAAWLRQDPDCMFPGGETLLESGDLDVTCVLDRGLDVGQWPSDPLDALLDKTGDRGVILLAERKGAFHFTLVDIVADIPHEVLVDLLGFVDHPPFLAEDVDGYDGEDGEDNHQPSTLRCHLD